MLNKKLKSLKEEIKTASPRKRALIQATINKWTATMYKCYTAEYGNGDCQNMNEEEYKYCEDCKDRIWGSTDKDLTFWKKRFEGLAKTADKSEQLRLDAQESLL